MITPNEQLSSSIISIMYFGEVMFAISGTLGAMRNRMGILGCAMLGIVTGISGATIRDLLLGRSVLWTQDPTELILCAAASLITYFATRHDISNHRGIVWSDALGLSVFGVVGCHAALESGVTFLIAVFIGMVTATVGGIIRDVLTNTPPLIVSTAQPYGTVACLGSLGYASLRYFAVPEIPSAAIACLVAFVMRAFSIFYDIQLRPPTSTSGAAPPTQSQKESEMEQGLEVLSTGKLMHVKVTGSLTKEAYEAFAPVVDRLILEHGKLRILFEMHDFHGWTAGALWEDIKFDFKHWKDIERLAIVGESKWEEGMAVFCKPFTAAKIHYFDHSKLSDAKAWLESE